MQRHPTPTRRAQPAASLPFLAAALLVLACGGKAGQADAPTIGAGGGTVTDGSGASVVVPPGALESDVTIRIAKDSTGAPALPASLVAAGDIYVITPHGGEFTAPVEVRIPAPAVTLQPNQELKLAKAQPGGDWVVLGDTQLQDGVLSAPVSSFSYFIGVTVPYPGPIAQFVPLQVTARLSCGSFCTSALGTVTATYTVTTNGGQLPASCSDGQLEIQDDSLDSNPLRSRVGQVIPLGGGALTRTLLPERQHYFMVALRCTDFMLGLDYGSYGSTVRWVVEPPYPYIRVMRMQYFLDVVEGSPATVEFVLSGGATLTADRESIGPTWRDRAIIDWERSDDGGGSWRVVGRSYQDEANPNPVVSVPWRYWSVHHGFLATAADQGALIRMRFCYTPPYTAPQPCEVSLPTQLNVLQQGALPSIINAPRAVLVRTGQTASFSAAAGGAPAPSLRWQTRAANATVAWTDVTSGTGATTGNYTTAPLTLADNGTQYRVVATNTLGTAESAVVTVSVSDLDIAPTITTQPASLGVTAGSDAAFAIAARGTEALSYQWRLDGTPITGANSPVLRLAAVTAAAAGGYSVVVSNAAGTVTSAVATLTVTAGVSAPVAPTIVTQPASVIVSAGNTATFAVGASGTGPLAFRWRKDGVDLAGATSAALTLVGVTSANAGVYSVVVSNVAGTVTSGNASLEISTAPPPVATAPVITTQPATLVVMQGAAATLAVAASGTGPLAFQWSHAGSAIAGATGAVLHLAAVTPADVGSYAVTVSNGAGSVTSATAQLIFVGAPAIAGQPAAASAVEGGTATFSVTASGDALRYQWQRDQVAIAGATSASYTTPALALADTGATFRVLVYNGAGLVVSASATLTVTAAPAVTGTTLASVTTTGSIPNNRCYGPSLSADGRRVAFLSDGTNLVPGTTVYGHAYVRDVGAGTTTLVDAALGGGESAARANSVKVAAGGRFVVFTSLANDLVEGDTNVANDVFLRDLETGTTTRLNVMPSGAQDDWSGNAVGITPDISADGRWVLIFSGVNLISDGAPLDQGQLFLRDTQAGLTRAVPGVAGYPGGALSPSGLFMAVITGSGSGQFLENHVMVYDVAHDSTTATFTINAASGIDYLGGVPSISDDGRFVAFTMRSQTLLAGQLAARSQVVVLDRDDPDAGTRLSLVSQTTAGVVGDYPSGYPAISGDGRYVAFYTNAPNLTLDPAATVRGYVMVRDRTLGTTIVASRRMDGSNVWVGPNYGAALSRDGGTIAFAADVADVVAPGTLGEYQIFVAPRP